MKLIELRENKKVDFIENDVIFDKDSFEITDLVIKKSGFSEQIKASENLVPMELVKVIGDKILLKGEDDI